MSEIIDYELPADLESTEYRVFPPHLEKDYLVVFHVTPLDNYEKILNDGFKSASSLRGDGLTSVSFAKESNGAVGHMLTLRKNGAECDFVILAVRYENLSSRPDLKINHSDIHDYATAPERVIIGRCLIPSDQVIA